ncbi:hypothetical protein K438DRAFT_1778885 [Mycena galopus ATCC 62051]|nr:hypothetical protein K438DRAFT_1778885 [Mycena galopus ATCC 62051]
MEEDGRNDFAHNESQIQRVSHLYWFSSSAPSYHVAQTTALGLLYNTGGALGFITHRPLQSEARRLVRQKKITPRPTYDLVPNRTGCPPQFEADFRHGSHARRFCNQAFSLLLKPANVEIQIKLNPVGRNSEARASLKFMMGLAQIEAGEMPSDQALLSIFGALLSCELMPFKRRQAVIELDSAEHVNSYDKKGFTIAYGLVPNRTRVLLNVSIAGPDTLRARTIRSKAFLMIRSTPAGNKHIRGHGRQTFIREAREVVVPHDHDRHDHYHHGIRTRSMALILRAGSVLPRELPTTPRPRYRTDENSNQDKHENRNRGTQAKGKRKQK